MSSFGILKEWEFFLDDADVALIHQVMNRRDLGFRELVDLAGLDPREDFRFANLAGVRLCGADLRGFDFTGADLTGTQLHRAIVDETTVLDGAVIGEDGVGDDTAALVIAPPNAGRAKGDDPYLQARHALQDGDVMLARERYDALPLIARNYLGCGDNFDHFRRVIFIEDKLLRDRLSKGDVEVFISGLLDIAVSIVGNGAAGNAVLPVEKAIYFSRLSGNVPLLLEGWAYLSVVSNTYNNNVCSQVARLVSGGAVVADAVARERISYVRDLFRWNRVAATVLDVIRGLVGAAALDDLPK